MANTPPLGEIRVNPRTFMSEVWDGKKWVDTVTPQMVNIGAVSGTISSGSYITGANGSTITTSSTKQFSENDKELMFEFLKENMRVAEYRDGNGKLENVELQLRLAVGYEWEPIKRAKIIRSKI